MDLAREEPLEQSAESARELALPHPARPSTAPSAPPSAARCCHICGRALTDEDGLALDCGGDCAACLALVGDPEVVQGLTAKLQQERRQLVGWCGWGAESVIAELDELREVVGAEEFCLHCACAGHHVWEHWADQGWSCDCLACQSAPDGHVCALDEAESARRLAAYDAGRAVSHLPARPGAG